MFAFIATNVDFIALGQFYYKGLLNYVHEVKLEIERQVCQFHSTSANLSALLVTMIYSIHFRMAKPFRKRVESTSNKLHILHCHLLDQSRKVVKIKF